MKAAVWHKKHDVRIENVGEPPVGAGEVKVRVKWTGICGSDIHEYAAGPIIIPAGTPHPLTGAMAPLVMGHEFSGEVVETGEGVTTLKTGDRVVVEPIIPCGKCPSCRMGKYNLCLQVACIGLSGNNCGGGFAEYAVAAANFVYKLPDSVSFEEAALVEPLTVALHSLRRARFATGQSALVLGCGPIGLATVECLKASGARIVVVLQRKSIKQEYARAAGADHVFDPDETNITDEVRKLTDGLGVDVAFETTGSQLGFDTALDSVTPDGTVVITSLWEAPISFNPNALVISEKTILGAVGYRHEFPMTLGLMADGRIKAGRYVTKRIHLDNLVEQGFKTLLGPEKKNNVKILVTPETALLRENERA